ncbi:MAG: ABC transporter ATP-binding protein [Ruminococcaceae bacterium]|nr:ABC transporter ATP-binding protein [Oscillospiraceae bacterium]
MELLTLEHLTFTYPEASAPTVSDVSLTIHRGNFTVICGLTGSGKSTLLRLIKNELRPRGTQSGTIRYRGTPMEELSTAVSASAIGFVMQDPEKQIVTDKVWHELAFGLENLGIPPAVIARRVAETAGYFGIEGWYHKSTDSLSGGQKQLLNLASVMVMDPDILILDEPTAQLDPIAASDFLHTLKKLNRELSLTILLVEHHAEEVIPDCHRLCLLEQGRLTACGAPREVLAALSPDAALWKAMPTAVRLGAMLGWNNPLPLTVREGRECLERYHPNTVRTLPQAVSAPSTHAVLTMQEIGFRYERTAAPVLNGFSLTVYENEILCLLGGNGSGKTTALRIAAGLKAPDGGSVSLFGKPLKHYRNGSLYRNCLSLLPQDVETVFLKNTVREELADAGLSADTLPFDLSPLLDRHPYDLSGGEKQLVALAKVLATKPKILFMDEPTKGLDAQHRDTFLTLLKQLKQQGVTIVLVTHDIDFASQCADRCVLLFDGRIVSEDTPERFFAENRFYTTPAARMTRGYYEQTVTVSQVAALCRLNGRTEGSGC